MKKLLYYRFYKPFGVLSQFTPDHPGQLCLSDFLQLPKDVYPLGRLDKDSEGLLLLTNDIRLNHQLLHPAKKLLKYYSCQLEGDPKEAKHLDSMVEGVLIKIQGKEFRAKAHSIRYLEQAPDFPERVPPIRFRKNVPDFWVEICLTEGKNRQIRRMCAALDFPVLRLVRTQIGNLNLEGLMPGEHQAISSSLFKM